MAKRGWLGIKLVSQAALIWLLIGGVILGILIGWAWFAMIRMPGESYRGSMPPLTSLETLLQKALQQDVEKLSGEIGEHNYLKYHSLVAAADFLEASLRAAGYEVHRQGYEVAKQTYYNLEVEIKGKNRSDEIVIIGGHYDSVFGSPGANDNSTGAAAVLELARAFAGKKT